MADTIELCVESETKLHEESYKKFMGGSFGKIYRKELLEHLLAAMKESDAGSLELTNHFFKPEMEYEEGDVEIIISLKLKRIGEEK